MEPARGLRFHVGIFAAAFFGSAYSDEIFLLLLGILQKKLFRIISDRRKGGAFDESDQQQDE